MKRTLAAILALWTAVLPGAVSAADVTGPLIGEGAARPTPVPTPQLPLSTDALALPSADLSGSLETVSLSAATPALRPNVLPERAQDGALPRAAASPLAQAQAALPKNAAESRDASQVRARSERVFSGARAAGDGRTDVSAGDGVEAGSQFSQSTPSGPALDRPTGRGPPSRREPPSGGKDGDGRHGPSKKVLSALILGVVGAILAFTPARAAAIDTLAAQAHVVAVDFAKHGPLLGAASAISAVGYDFSNVVGFLYPLTQVHTLFKHRSGKVSLSSQITGMGASLLLAFNMFFLNRPGASTLFSAYQNLFGGLTFAAIIGQVLYFNARPGKEGEKPSRLKVLAQTAGVVALVAAATAVLGAGVTGWLPTIHAAPLIVPFQMLLGFGFAYLTLPGYLKIEREKSVGAASFSTTAMFFLANSSLVIWSLYRIATLPGLSVMSALAGGAAFAAVATFASHVAFRWLAARKWAFLPERIKVWGRTIAKAALIDLSAFVAVSALMTGLVAAGYAVLHAALHVPQAQTRDFLTFMFYLVDVILASTSSVLTMRAFRKYKR